MVWNFIKKINIRRDTNAVVESWMRFIKHSVLKNKSVPIRDFIRKTMKNSSNRCLQLCNERKIAEKIASCSDIETKVEKWSGKIGEALPQNYYSKDYILPSPSSNIAQGFNLVGSSEATNPQPSAINIWDRSLQVNKKCLLIEDVAILRNVEMFGQAIGAVHAPISTYSVDPHIQDVENAVLPGSVWSAKKLQTKTPVAEWLPDLGLNKGDLKILLDQKWKFILNFF